MHRQHSRSALHVRATEGSQGEGYVSDEEDGSYIPEAPGAFRSIPRQDQDASLRAPASMGGGRFVGSRGGVEEEEDEEGYPRIFPEAPGVLISDRWESPIRMGSGHTMGSF